MIKLRYLLCTTILLSLLTGCGGSSSNGGSPTDGPDPQPIPNQAPTVAFDNEYVFNEGEDVSVVLTISDSDGSIDSTIWEPISGPSVAVETTTNSIGFTAPQTDEDSYVLVFRLTATDDDGAQTAADINIRILNINQAPTVVVANEYVFNEGEDVSVVLAISDADGTVDSTIWEPISGPSVTIETTTNSIGFTAPQTNDDSYVLVFRLTATDDDGAQTTADVNIRILNINQAPTVVFDNEYVFNEGEDVSVVLAISDADGSIDTAVWESISGPSVAVETTTNSISFTAPQTNEDSYVLVFRLTVTDDDGAQTTADINIRILNINQPPTLVFENVYVFDELTDATISIGIQDADGSVASVFWRLISGVNVDFDPNATILAFTAPEVAATGEILEFEITATDDDGASASQAITINVVDVNKAPVAIMSDNYSLFLGTGANFNASGSFDPDGDMITYQWTVIDPNSNELTIANSNSVALAFTPEVLGDYNITLIVTDPSDLTDETSGTLTVVQGNLPPTASITVVTSVTTGTNVTAQGNASSDPDGDDLTYLWTLVSPNTSAAILTSETNSTTSFVADIVGEFTLSLTVNDGELDSETFSVVITSEMANSAPVANAGNDMSLAINSAGMLDGTTSDDIDGNNLTYDWDLISSSTSTVLTLSDRTLAQPTFIATAAGEFVFRLTVSDGELTSSDNVMITVFEADIIMCSPTAALGNENCDLVRFAWPYTGSITEATGTTQTFVGLLTYVIIADGADYQVNITLVDRNGFVEPFLEGIVDGQVIRDGERVEFNMKSPLTNNQQADISYIIEIEGLPTYVHSVDILLTTN